VSFFPVTLERLKELGGDGGIVHRIIKQARAHLAGEEPWVQHCCLVAHPLDKMHCVTRSLQEQGKGGTDGLPVETSIDPATHKPGGFVTYVDTSGGVHNQLHFVCRCAGSQAAKQYARSFRYGEPLPKSVTEKSLKEFLDGVGQLEAWEAAQQAREKAAHDAEFAAFVAEAEELARKQGQALADGDKKREARRLRAQAQEEARKQQEEESDAVAAAKVQAAQDAADAQCPGTAGAGAGGVACVKKPTSQSVLGGLCLFHLREALRELLVHARALQRTDQGLIDAIDAAKGYFEADKLQVKGYRRHYALLYVQVGYAEWRKARAAAAAQQQPVGGAVR
jgi:hypothetical protein